ncbi:DMT family transporter [Bacillus haynesii]|uniref:DMT family transporter n=1 Tax=Bacillus haynesii TaxID=1925021 RepID=A0AA90EX90_9BACI|nr:DMT family transporter [Bacillus haynesii]MCY7791669.1 DMT family transporter [Bacillus haynesii]MCY9282135.1 DMT family transporter [Bacillus haynesii]MCY9391446.1 DMT family transporter [Bacillus haynesii]
MRNPISVYFSLALAMAIVGSSVVVGKLMVETIPVFLSSGIRFFIAAAVLMILLFWIEKGFPALSKKDVFVLLLQSFTGVFLFSVCMLYGVKLTTGMESGIITSTTPMAVGVLAFFLLKEKIEKRLAAGIVLAVIGVLAINRPGLLDWSYVLYYALIVTVLAFYLWYNGVTKVPAGVSGIFTSVLPVSAVVLSGIILKEQFTVAHFTEVLFVLAGVFASIPKN